MSASSLGGFQILSVNPGISCENPVPGGDAGATAGIDHYDQSGDVSGAGRVATGPFEIRKVWKRRGSGLDP